MTLEKTLYERFLHAVIFELVALLLCAPVMSWLLGVSFAHAGLLTLMISLVAMTWNVVFNSIFDRLERIRKAASAAKTSLERSFRTRIVHAVVFEAGLILAVVPLAAWWLDIGLVEAFVLDIGLVLFFLPYTLVFNWAYDKIRAGMLKSATC